MFLTTKDLRSIRLEVDIQSTDKEAAEAYRKIVDLTVLEMNLKINRLNLYINIDNAFFYCELYHGLGQEPSGGEELERYMTFLDRLIPEGFRVKLTETGNGAIRVAASENPISTEQIAEARRVWST